MMRWIMALAFTLLLVGHACAQQRNAHWPIPPGSWLHFDDTGTHVEPWVSSAISNYQSASISSPSGVLQLYNDQRDIQNANGDTLIASSIPTNDIMPGQGWVYCPWPGDSDRIAGFGMRRDGYWSNIYDLDLKCHSFNRDLATGLWQYEAGSEQVLIDSTAFKLTAVTHSNGADYWIITHLHSSDTFAAFRLSATGVDPVPVISHTGYYMPVESLVCCPIALTGSLVASYDGTRLALSVRHHGSSFGNILYSMLYHFDTSTGVVTANALLPGIPLTVRYGTEFSMDGTKLYQLHANHNGDGNTPASITLRQYELSSQDPAQIAESAVVIHLENGLPLESVWGDALNMVTGPDGRIYVLRRNNGRLSVINEPNAAGAACNFVVDQVLLPDTLANTLPNQCKRYHDSEFSVGVPAMQQEPVELEVWPVPAEGLVQVRSRNAGQLVVLDALGRTVFSRSIGENTILHVDLSRSNAGAYAVHLLAPGAAPVHRMIMKW